MENNPPRLSSTTDLLYILRSNNAWPNIAEYNRILNSATDYAAYSQAEMEAFGSVPAMLGGGIEQATIKAIGYAVTDDLVSLEPVSIVGKYEAVTSVPARFFDELYADNVRFGLGGEALALCVKALHNNKPKRFYFPLDPATFVQLESEVYETDLPDNIERIRRIYRLAKRVINDKMFKLLDDEDKEYQMQPVVDDLNAVLDEILQSDETNIQCKKFTKHSLKNGIYRVEESSSKNNMIKAHQAKFVWINGEFVLQILDKQKAVDFRIKIPDIYDIISITDDGEAAATTDLFDYFDSDYDEISRDLPTDLKYTADYCSDEDFEEVYRNSVDDIEERLPQPELLESVGLTGFVYVVSDDGYRLEFIDSNAISITGADFIKNDGEYRAVLRASEYDIASGDEREVFIVPSRNYLVRFESYAGDSTYEKNDDLIELIHREANTARSIVLEPDFYELPLDEQKELLDTPRKNVSDHLQAISEFIGECRIGFTVQAYRTLPGDLMDVVPWRDTEIMISETEQSTSITLSADNIVAYNPETEDYDSTAPYSSLNDFPLSGGEPTLILEDKGTNLFYLVRARDIVSMMPVFEA